LRCEGDPDRRHTRLPGILMNWLQRRHLEVDRDEPMALATSSVRSASSPTYRGLRLVRPTGTDG
jgi:hypothetical protein